VCVCVCVCVCLVARQQIKVTLNDDDMDTFVFAVGTKKAMAKLQKDMQDLVNHHHHTSSPLDPTEPNVTLPS